MPSLYHQSTEMERERKMEKGRDKERNEHMEKERERKSVEYSATYQLDGCAEVPQGEVRLEACRSRLFLIVLFGETRFFSKCQLRGITFEHLCKRIR